MRLTVIDNGPGFADKVLKRAFEPYVTTKAKGTGLGTRVVNGVAATMGAEIQYLAREPGTAARLVFPLAAV